MFIILGLNSTKFEKLKPPNLQAHKVDWSLSILNMRKRRRYLKSIQIKIIQSVDTIHMLYAVKVFSY
jgi:hypothetical protein